MKRDRVRALVDRLVSRDGAYRPLELLKLTGRLESRDEQRWVRGEVAFLEERFYGHPGRVAEMLRTAAEWARRLELADEVDTVIPAQAARIFRNAVDDRLARTAWQRRQVSQQADLFFDNGHANARHQLQRALLDGDRARSEQHLAELARSQPHSEILADAEHLVGALAWLEAAPQDIVTLARSVESALAPRARRLLGGEDAERYLARFWVHLAGHSDPTCYDPARHSAHPAALLERAGRLSEAIAAVLAVSDHRQHPELLACLARSGLAGGRRDLGWQAIVRMCWHHPSEAERFFEMCRDEEVQRRIERFWDLEPPLPAELFPAWLATVSFALPELHADDSRGSKALSSVMAARSRPGHRKAREWLAAHEPQLLHHWRNAGRA
jgi:hypothetical protein